MSDTFFLDLLLVRKLGINDYCYEESPIFQKVGSVLQLWIN